MAKRYCQSCGMPLGATGDLCGTDSGGGKNSDFCRYCFEDGVFTVECTMDEMIDFCVPHMTAAHAGMSGDEARRMMRESFPALKRWRQA